MRLRLRALAEGLRGSLFYLPSLFVIAGGLLAWGVVRFQLQADSDDPLPLILSVTVESARSILSTIAAATITVAGIVFSVTVVSVQLASSQFSPRVLRGFLRDRFQQSIIGLMVGTFTYCLFVLATTRVTDGGGSLTASPSLSVTIAIVLAVASILGIIAFIDHSARSAQVGEIIRGVATETRERIDQLYAPASEGDGGAVLPESSPPVGVRQRVLRARADGWIQQLDATGRLSAAPPGAYLRLDAQVGDYVTADTPLVTYWAEDGELNAARVHEEFVVGGGRTMQQDVRFGVRQLVDVALRALSAGVNDPTTAIEVVVHLGSVLTDLLQRDLPPRVITGDDGRVLVIPDAPGHAEFVDEAVDQIRIAASMQPAVLIRLLATLGQLDEVLVAAQLAHRTPPLRRQAELVLATADDAGLLPDDLARVHAAATAIPRPDGTTRAPGDE